jgi:molecular chaperone GrpE (heat shock protein)
MSIVKSFLVTGPVGQKQGQAPAEEETAGEAVAEDFFDETVVEDVVVTEGMPTEPEAAYVSEPEQKTEEPSEPEPVPDVARREGSDDAEGIRAAVESLRGDLERYTTTKEQLKEYSAIVAKRDAETANRKLMSMLEQLSAMREDFFKLCKGMRPKLDSFSSDDVLSSFEAYGVDMENILADCGVFVGPFQYDRLNTLHQRIVDVIPTEDESLNGKIAERVTSGYEYCGRVLYKERVNIYKFTKMKEQKGDE